MCTHDNHSLKLVAYRLEHTDKQYINLHIEGSSFDPVTPWAFHINYMCIFDFSNCSAIRVHESVFIYLFKYYKDVLKMFLLVTLMKMSSSNSASNFTQKLSVVQKLLSCRSFNCLMRFTRSLKQTNSRDLV